MSTGCNRRGPKGCQCKCNFGAGFAYRAETCTVQFAVGDIFVDNIQINPADADLTVVIEGPDGVEDGIVDFGDSLFWESWQPAQNAVYTATVTLICDSTTVTREYSFTIPSDANQACNCCTLRTLDYITVDGLSGDFSSLNGTFAITSKSSGSPCSYGVVDGPAEPAVPATPCGPDLFEFPLPVSPDAMYQCGQSFPVTTKYYFYPGSISVGGWDALGNTANIQVTAGSKVRVSVSVWYRVYRFRIAPPHECTNFGTSLVSWRFEADCEGGPMELVQTLTGFDLCQSVGIANVPPLPYSAAPVVELFFE
jgi:hypothetical protein